MKGQRFAWTHTLLSYGAFGYMLHQRILDPWIMTLPFAFSSLMCRVVGLSDLVEMMHSAQNVLKRQQPEQRQLDIDQTNK